MGTLLATVALAELPPPASDAQAKRPSIRCSSVVSDHLGNTPAVCRASYVHPARDRRVPRRHAGRALGGGVARGSRLLVPEERKLLQLLRPRTPKPCRRADAA